MKEEETKEEKIEEKEKPVDIEEKILYSFLYNEIQKF